MTGRVKKYKGKKTLYRSISESAINVVFVKNLFERNRKNSNGKTKQNPLELNDLPPVDANHDLLNDSDLSFHVKRLDDTFDKLKYEDNPFDQLKHQNDSKCSSHKPISGHTVSDDAGELSELSRSITKISNGLSLNLNFTNEEEKSEILKNNVDTAELDDILSYSQIFYNSNHDIQGSARRKKSVGADFVQFEPGVEPIVDVAIRKVPNSPIKNGLMLCSTPISTNRKLKTLEVLTPIKVHDSANNAILEQSLKQVYDWSYKAPEVSAYEPSVKRTKRRLAINGYKMESDKSDSDKNVQSKKRLRKSSRRGPKRKCNASKEKKALIVKKFAANQTPSPANLNDATKSIQYGVEVIPLSIQLMKLPDEHVYDLIKRQSERYQDAEVDVNESTEKMHNTIPSIIKSCIHFNKTSSHENSEDDSVEIHHQSCSPTKSLSDVCIDLTSTNDEENAKCDSSLLLGHRYSPDQTQCDTEENHPHVNTRKKNLARQDRFEDFYTSMYSSVQILCETAEVAEVAEEPDTNEESSNKMEESSTTVPSTISSANLNKSRFVCKRRRYSKRLAMVQQECPSSTDSDSDNQPSASCIVQKVQLQSSDLFDTTSSEDLQLVVISDDGSNCNISSSSDKVMELPNIDAVKIRPTVFFVQPGKSWRRSLALAKRNTMIAESENLEGQKGTLIGCEDSQGNRSSIIRRRTRFSLSSSVRKIPHTSRSTEYEQNRLREAAALETLIENISLNVSQLNVSHTSYPEARQLVLQRCKQTAPINFTKWYPDNILRNCHKIGEGVYGEVFLFRSAGTDATSTVMKVIPIEGEMLVNGERQKQFDEILSEVVIAAELSQLRNNFTNQTTGFNQLKSVRCLKGKYPERLIELWELFEENRGSENDNPKMFDDDQLYIVLELANAGADLESFMFTDYSEVYQMFLQIILSLAVAEEELQFEHRDLHWGNVLINRVAKSNVSHYKLCGESISVPTNAVEANIIDFTLSRITYNKISIFNDLSQDPDLFNADGDYQFKIYKMMQLANSNNWEPFQPKTNILWLHYVLVKTTSVNIRRKTVNGRSKKCLHTLVDWENKILHYASANHFVQEVILPHLKQNE